MECFALPRALLDFLSSHTNPRDHSVVSSPLSDIVHAESRMLDSKHHGTCFGWRCSDVRSGSRTSYQLAVAIAGMGSTWSGCSNKFRVTACCFGVGIWDRNLGVEGCI